jgi:hypothetical protein
MFIVVKERDYYYYYYYYYYLFIYLFTTIGFAPGGSSPTLVQTKTIKQHCTVVQHNTITALTVHSTNFSIITITRGRYNRPGVAAVPSGPSMDSTPQYLNKEKILDWGTVGIDDHIFALSKTFTYIEMGPPLTIAGLTSNLELLL